MSSTRISQEKDTVSKMIQIYCRAHHHHADQLCDACEELEHYAHLRLDKCPYGAKKPNCKRCPHHCYKPQQREQIRIVMRYAGPRMLCHYPLATFRYLFSNKAVRR